MKNDIVATFRLDAQQSIAYLGSCRAKGGTLKEAMVNVFREIPRCEHFNVGNVVTLLPQHPDSYGKRLIESILAGGGSFYPGETIPLKKAVKAVKTEEPEVNVTKRRRQRKQIPEDEIFTLHKSGCTTRYIAGMLNISAMTVSRILNGQRRLM